MPQFIGEISMLKFFTFCVNACVSDQILHAAALCSDTYSFCSQRVLSSRTGVQQVVGMCVLKHQHCFSFVETFIKSQ